MTPPLVSPPPPTLSSTYRNREEFQRFGEETMRSTAEKQKHAEESKKRGVTKLTVTPLYYVQPAPPPNYFDDEEEGEVEEDVVVDDDGEEGEIHEGITSSSGIGSMSTPLLSEESASRSTGGDVDGDGGVNLKCKVISDDDDDEYILV